MVDGGPAAGDRAVFVVLDDGLVVLEEGEEALDQAVLAELDVRPPYRAEAIRRHDATWVVGARSILVVELDEAQGDALELVWDGTERSLRVDGEPSLGSVPQLEAFAAARYGTWVVRAARLRGSLWEVELAPL
jgi:hypothetical protein